MGTCIRLDLPQRGDEPFGIAREQNPRCVGKRFAAARDGKLDEHRADRREDGKHDRDDEKYLARLAVIAARAVRPCRRRKATAGKCRRSSEMMPARIAATVETRMSRLPTCESSCARTPCKLGLIEPLERALRHGNRGMLAGRGPSRTR